MIQMNRGIKLSLLQAEKLLMAETHAKMRTVALMQNNARAGITGWRLRRRQQQQQQH